MKIKHHWHKTPARGMRNPLSETHRYTVVRLDDGAERFTDRKPRPEVLANPYLMVWDNRNKEQPIARQPLENRNHEIL